MDDQMELIIMKILLNLKKLELLFSEAFGFLAEVAQFQLNDQNQNNDEYIAQQLQSQLDIESQIERKR